MDIDPTQFTVALSKVVYLSYLEQTIIVTIKATDQSDPSRFNDVATFSIYFNRDSVITSECKQSVLQDPAPPLSTVIIELMSSATPTVYSFSSLVDSGTVSL